MEHFLCDDVGGKHNVCGMNSKVTYCHICTIPSINMSVIYFKKSKLQNGTTLDLIKF